MLLIGAALGMAAPARAQDDAAAYVRARAADARGAAAVAAAGYAEALGKAPNDTLLALRAYRQALASGDMALARRGADILEKAGVAPPDTALFDFSLALRGDDRLREDAALKRLRKGPLDFLAPVLDAWLAFDRKGDPIKVIDAASGNLLAARYTARHRALLLIAQGKPALGVVALQPSLEISADDLDLRIDAASLLAAAGEGEAARGLLAGREPGMARLRDRLNGVMPNARFGASRLFLSLASDLAREDTETLSILLTRMALLLDPTDDRARLPLGEALSKSGSDAAALAVLEEVGRDSPFARGAAAGEIAVLARAGRGAEAIGRARALARDREATEADARTYGDLLAAAGRYEDAARAYGDAIARSDGDAAWRLYLLRGQALERADRWRQAEPALRRAVALAPEEPEALGALAGAQIERGEHLDESRALIERARKIEPRDPELAGALAWSYYQEGEVGRALPLLETAARQDPGGVRINEHLGDAYWQLGRRYEARYAWRAAAVYADASDAKRIAAKLARGPVSAQ